MPSSSAPLRIGILSTAKIARQFVAGVRPSTAVEVVAVASRDATKAAAFANELGIARHYDSYDSMLAAPDIEAIYVPLPNGLHAEWSIRAMLAGKHVLCEKPLAASAASAREMFATARRHGVHVVEGYPYCAQPQTLRMRELLSTGAIGRVQIIQASFGFTLADEANIRLDPSLAGGAVMDVGSYCVSLARIVAGERPARVSASASWTDGGVDRTLVATIEFPSGLLAQIGCSFATALHRQALIVGTNGALQTTFFNHPSPIAPPLLQLKRGKERDTPFETLEVPATNGFLAEAESFARLVRHGPEQWHGVTPEESVDIALTLDALRQSAHTRSSVMISP